MTQPIENRLTLQTLVGMLPTLLASAGLFVLAEVAVARVRSRPELLLIPLLSLVALAGTLYYAHAYPTVDGDTVKGLFILPASCHAGVRDVLRVRGGDVGSPLSLAGGRSRSPRTVCFVVSLAFGIA